MATPKLTFSLPRQAADIPLPPTKGGEGAQQTFNKAVRRTLQDLWERVSLFIARKGGASADANKPQAGVPGAVWFSTDQSRGNLDDGTNWNQWSLKLLDVGTVTVSGALATGTASLTAALADTSYRLAVVPISSTGSPVLGSNRLLSVSKTVSQFTITVEVAPGVGNSVTFDWLLMR